MPSTIVVQSSFTLTHSATGKWLYEGRRVTCRVVISCLCARQVRLSLRWALIAL